MSEVNASGRWSASDQRDVREAFNAVPVLGSVKKDEEGDWDNWEWRIRLAFEASDVFGLVTSDTTYGPGYIPEPANTLPLSPQYTLYHQKSSWAYSKIVQYSSAAVAQEIRHVRDARSAFEILRASHSVPTAQELTKNIVRLVALRVSSTKDVLSTFLPAHSQLVASIRRLSPEFVAISNGVVYNTFVSIGLML
jgi:hypothetical protein